jgi:pimeloyl-ACP methyl ester carboxylesterase
MSDSGEIIVVHGLWFGAWSMAPLARRLARGGLPVRRFNYRSTRGDLDEHAANLRDFARESGALQQHFVGHSLGGLVILNMLARYDDPAPGRVVLLGSPVGGSRVADKARNLPGSQALFGKVSTALERGYDAAPPGRDVGMIAGSRSVGLGWLVGGTGGPGDGTVALAETRAPWLRDHRVLPLTHTGLVLSAEAAHEALRFLENGAFEAHAA